MAISIDPGLVIAYRGRGRVLFELKEYQHALLDLDEAINLDPKHGGSFFNRALIHYQLGNLELTCKDLEQAKAMEVKPATKALQSYCENVN